MKLAYALMIFIPLVCYGQKRDEPPSVMEVVLQSGFANSVESPALQQELEDKWPQHESPTVLNGMFEKPSGVWKVDGGHLIAYDAGEWGGSLFFLPKGKRQLERVIKDFAASIAYVGNNTYIVAGGLAHGREHGAVYRLWIDKKLEWQSEQLFNTWIGTPSVIFRLQGNRALVVISEDILIGEGENRVVKGVYEIDSSGRLKILGVPEKK